MRFFIYPPCVYSMNYNTVPLCLNWPHGGKTSVCFWNVEHMTWLILHGNILTAVFVFTAMSSYLYIVKYELPIVIESFMGVSTGWVAKYWISFQTQKTHLITHRSRKVENKCVWDPLLKTFLNSTSSGQKVWRGLL